SAPVAAVSTTKPSSSRLPLIVNRMFSSSSTTRTRLSTMSEPFLRRGPPFAPLGVGHDQIVAELDQHPRSPRLVRGQPDDAPVIGDDPLDDGQSQARPALLGGKVRLEHLVLQLLCNAAAEIAH